MSTQIVPIIYQHRNVKLISTEDAGKFAAMVCEETEIEYVLARYKHGNTLLLAAEMYYEMYWSIGLRQRVAASYGHQTRSELMSPMETLTQKQMDTWRKWCLDRGCMDRKDAREVDSVVIWGNRVREHRRLVNGLHCLAKRYRIG